MIGARTARAWGWLPALSGLVLASANAVALQPDRDPAEAAQAPPERASAGARILERVAAGIFGVAAGQVGSVRVVYLTTLHSADEPGPIEQRVSYVFPDTVRHEVQTPLGEQSIVFDGEGGFIAAGGRRLPLGAEAVAEGRRQMARDLILLAAHAGDARLECAVAGSDAVDGKPCDLVTIAFLGATSRLCVDRDGRVARQTFEGRHPLSGETGEITLRYEDYAETGGLVLPRRQVLSFRGEELATMRLAQVELDPQLPDLGPPPAP